MKNLEKYFKLGNEIKVIKIEEETIEDQTWLNIHIESKKKKVKCPNCEQFTRSIHDKLKPTKIKYLKLFEVPTNIVIRKRRFVCHKCKIKFTEKIDIVEKNKNISNKLKIKILKDLLDYNKSLKSIGKENEISDNEVRCILEEAMSDYPEHRRLLPKVISLDEFKADTNEGKYACILTDPTHKKVLDILPSRKKERLLQYFTYCENRHSVEFVISDMYEPYLLVTKTMFPKAKFVVDRFHYIRYIMDALDKIRIRLQKEYGPNSKEYKILKNKKNVALIRKYSNEIDWWTYTKRYRNGHLVEVLKFDIKKQILNINEELRRGYQLKEEFLDIINHTDITNCEEQFLNWIDLCVKSNILEFIEAAKTIYNWLEYICNSFIDEKYSNGFTEGINNKIKIIKRIGFGYRNFKFLRLRLLYLFNSKISGKVKNNGFQKSKKVKNQEP